MWSWPQRVPFLHPVIVGLPPPSLLASTDGEGKESENKPQEVSGRGSVPLGLPLGGAWCPESK